MENLNDYLVMVERRAERGNSYTTNELDDAFQGGLAKATAMYGPFLAAKVISDDEGGWVVEAVREHREGVTSRVDWAHPIRFVVMKPLYAGPWREDPALP